MIETLREHLWFIAIAIGQKSSGGLRNGGEQKSGAEPKHGASRKNDERLKRANRPKRSRPRKAAVKIKQRTLLIFSWALGGRKIHRHPVQPLDLLNLSVFKRLISQR
jgi:hypothetical protein